MNNSQILPWHETPSSPRSVFQDGVALSFLSRWTSCVEGTVLSRGGPLGFCLGGIITYTSASHLPSFSCPLKRSLLSSLFCLGLSGSTAHPAVVPLRSHKRQYRFAAVVPPWLHSSSTTGGLAPPLVLSLFERSLLSRARPSGSTALPAVLRPKGHKRQYRSTAVLPPLTPLP